MTIKVEFEFATLELVAEFFARVRTGELALVTPDKQKKKKAVLDVIPPVEDTAPTAYAPIVIRAGTPLEDLPPTLSTYVMGDLRAALATLLATKGVEACSAVLADHKVARISELPESAYAQFVADCIVA